MLVIFHPDATGAQIEAVILRIAQSGAGTQRVDGAEQTVVGVIDADRDHIAGLELDADAGVDRVVPVSSPYKLAHKHRHGGRAHPVSVAGIAFGGPEPAFRLILGPCAVETREQTLSAARACAAAGADLLRGGAFKPRTSPYAFQGLGLAGLEILAAAREETGLPIVTELTDLRDVEAVVEHADCIQVGARNMQHFPLLTEIGRAGLPVLLKRGMGASIDDFLLAAEYILTEGNADVVLCERGVHATSTPARSCLDLAAVTVLKEHTHLPVIVDPSHAAGRRALVEPLALAAAACGADGLIVECHPNPSLARCDGPQAIPLEALDGFCARVRAVAAAAAAPVPA